MSATWMNTFTLFGALCMFLFSLPLFVIPTSAQYQNDLGSGVEVGSSYLSGMTASRHPQLTILTADSSQYFLKRAALMYSLLRPDVTITVIDVPPTTSSGPRLAFSKLGTGVGDAAIMPYSPAATDAVNQPDLEILPMWCTAAVPVYNLPGVLSLILSPTVLGKIFMGNITQWNDPMIQSLNPGNILPSHPIEVVVQSEPRQISKLFTKVSGDNDPAFAALIPSASLPKWPFKRYAKYSQQYGYDGPASYVAATPYTLAFTLAAVATRMPVPAASVVNAYGRVVSPQYSNIVSGITERIVRSQEDPISGQAVFSYNTDLAMAKGANSWPYLIAVSLILPKTFSTQGCVERSELVKFIRWLMYSDSVRYSLCISEHIGMPNSIVYDQLNIDNQLYSLTCNARKISNGVLDPIALGGAAPVTLHAKPRLILTELYSATDNAIAYKFYAMDEGLAIRNVLLPQTLPDLLYFQSMTTSIMYADNWRRYIDSGHVEVLHIGIHGVVPRYNLHPAVLAILQAKNQLPLAIDVETLASIFLGDITSWVDDRMLRYNPGLGDAFSQSGIDSDIHLVFTGKGRIADAPVMGITHHLIAHLNNTNAFRNSGINWKLPVDWSPVAKKLDFQGLPYSWVLNEVMLEDLIINIPNSFGYIIGAMNTTDITQDMHLIRMVEDPVNPYGAKVPTVVSPIPVNYLECAANNPPTGEIAWAFDAAASPSYALRNCWPLPVVVSIGVRNDVTTSAVTLDADGNIIFDDSASSTVASTFSSTLDLANLCFRQSRVIKFANWLASSSSLIPPFQIAGRGSFSAVPAWYDYMTSVIRECKCGGTPILYTPPVYWSLSSSVRNFGYAIGAIGLLFGLLIFIGLIIYRRRTIVKTANLPMQFGNIIGMLLMFIAVILFSMTPTMNTCNALGWMLPLGYSMMFMPICSKIIRVYYIASQKRSSMKVVKVKTAKLHIFNSVICGSVLALLAISQGMYGGFLKPIEVIVMQNSVENYYLNCSLPTEAMPFAIIVFGVPVTILVISAILAFGARHVSSAFNESRNCSWAVWNGVLSTMIVIPLFILIGGLQSDIGVFLLMFLVAWNTLSALIFCFGLKFYTLLSEDIFAHFRAVRSMSSGRSLGSKDSSMGTTSGTFTSNETMSSSAFNFPSLECATLAVLEKYITVIESQIRQVQARRKTFFGAEYKSINALHLSNGRFHSHHSRGQSHEFSGERSITAPKKPRVVATPSKQQQDDFVVVRKLSAANAPQPQSPSRSALNDTTSPTSRPMTVPSLNVNSNALQMNSMTGSTASSNAGIVSIPSTVSSPILNSLHQRQPIRIGHKPSSTGVSMFKPITNAAYSSVFKDKEDSNRTPEAASPTGSSKQRYANNSNYNTPR